jgi:sec-independent protein translocase protein TatC
MYLSFLIGIMVSSPIIGYELAAFIGPALYPHEKKHIRTFIFAFIGTFAFGIAMAYFLILPLTFRVLIWFIKSGGAAPFINIQDFYSVIIGLMLACGLFYTAPVFVVLVAQAGILPTRFLAEFNVGKRRTMYLAILLIITISPIPPDPTPISSLVMLIPFIIIFEAARFLFLRSAHEIH